MQQTWPHIRRIIHRSLAAGAMAALPAWAQFTTVDIEQAPTLAALVTQLGAQAAQPSTYLKLDMPDVVLAGPVQVKAMSALPGTTTLVLVKGLFTASSAAPAAQLAPPPQLARKRPAGTEAPGQPPPSVWIDQAFFKAGQTSELKTRFDVDRTEDYTLFAHSQGRWWFVTRQIKVGLPSQSPKSARR